jgi:hypothetical protein
MPQTLDLSLYSASGFVSKGAEQSVAITSTKELSEDTLEFTYLFWRADNR